MLIGKSLIITAIIICLYTIDGTNGKHQCVRSISTASSYTDKKGPFCVGQLMFEDNFTKLDFRKWHVENYISYEFQTFTYDRENAFIKNKTLHIRPTFYADKYGKKYLTSSTQYITALLPTDICTNFESRFCKEKGTAKDIIHPIRSASIRTLESFSFKYGKVEIEAKLPSGDWLWPQILLLPKYDVYGYGLESGQIVLVESRGNRHMYIKNKNVGVKQIRAKLDYAINLYTLGGISFVTNDRTQRGFDKNFHVYGMKWSPKTITFYLDGEKTGSINSEKNFFERSNFPQNATLHNPWRNASKLAPFDQQFYIVIRLNVGGTNDYFPDVNVQYQYRKPWHNVIGHRKLDFWQDRSNWMRTWNLYDKNNDDRDFQIKKVRVYAL